MRAASAAREGAPLFEAERAALLGFLETVTRKPYPFDELHGSNRLYDTNINMAVDLLDASGGCPAETLLKLSKHSDFPMVLRLSLIRRLAGDDEPLINLQKSIEKETHLNAVAARLLLATTSTMKNEPNQMDSERLFQALSFDDEAYAHMVEDVRTNWSAKAYLPLAARLLRGNHELGFGLLESIDVAEKSTLEAHREMLLSIDEDGIKNRRAAGALVLAKHRMKWMTDDDAITWISREKSGTVAEDVAESLMTTLQPDSVVALREHVRNEALKQSIDLRLRGNDNQ